MSHHKPKKRITHHKKPFMADTANRELLQNLLKIGEEESLTHTVLTQQLIRGEASSLMANFNPKNHLLQLHQKKYV